MSNLLWLSRFSACNIEKLGGAWGRSYGAWSLELSAEVKGQNVGDESSAHHATFRALPRTGAIPAPYNLPIMSGVHVYVHVYVMTSGRVGHVKKLHYYSLVDYYSTEHNTAFSSRYY